ncbi:hypothetical protein EP47_10555, partial [Legionella norrlandica]
MILTRLVQIVILFTLYVVNFNSHAVAFTVIPKAGTALPKEVVIGNTVFAYYTVINNTKRPLTNIFVKYLPLNVSQIVDDPKLTDICGYQFALASGGSCTLKLAIRGAVDASDPNPQNHLFICHPNIPACAGTYYPLNVVAHEPTIKGIVQSGGTTSVLPLANAVVKIYAANTDTSSEIGSAITNSQGEFFIYISPDVLKMNNHHVIYALAQKNSAVILANVIGTAVIPSIIINELTTVAASYSMMQFFHDHRIYGSLKGTDIASMMSANLVSAKTGALSDVINNSPNADQTNARRSLSTLANLITPCVRNGGINCTNVFNAATVNGNVPSNTLDALLNIGRNPSNSVVAIFNLAAISQPFTPYLNAIPDAWTIAVKFNATGDEQKCPFGGPGGIAIDNRGFIWLTNNVIQSTPNAINCAVVLKPNGQPADGSNLSPKSPLFGGGLLGTGFGNDVAPDQSVWFGNFGWGSCSNCLPNGSASKFTSTGYPISGPNGYQSASPADLYR